MGNERMAGKEWRGMRVIKKTKRDGMERKEESGKVNEGR